MTKLPFELFLGLRYLKPKRTFVSVITLISLTGVIISVWVLLVVIAVMSGFDRELRDKLIGIHPHVTIMGKVLTAQEADKVSELARANPRVKAASPYVLGLVLVEFGRRVATPYIKGIDPEQEVHISRLKDYITRGELDVAGEKVVMGRELAGQLGVYVGDRITVYSPRNFEKRGEEVYLPMELEVTGIFESGMYEFDVTLMFTSLETAQDLYELGGGVHGLEIATGDPMTEAPLVADDLNQQLRHVSPELHAETWADMNKQILGAIQVEKAVMFFILIFIIIVAAFGIMSTLITVTVQKTREIGVLKALGATAGKILGVFLFHGFMVGVAGIAIAVALALVTIANINPINRFLSNTLHLELFPKKIYNFPEIPASLSGGDLTIICLSALAICTIAALIPAWRASRLEPVEALHAE